MNPLGSLGPWGNGAEGLLRVVAQNLLRPWLDEGLMQCANLLLGSMEQQFRHEADRIAAAAGVQGQEFQLKLKL